MALALQIFFNDPKRKTIYHPFSFQDVLLRSWWPLAKRLALPLLQQLECLFIRDQEQAESLLRELEVVRGALQDPENVGVSRGDAAYMLQRISEVEPLIRETVKEWTLVDHLSL